MAHVQHLMSSHRESRELTAADVISVLNSHWPMSDPTEKTRNEIQEMAQVFIWSWMNSIWSDHTCVVMRYPVKNLKHLFGDKHEEVIEELRRRGFHITEVNKSTITGMLWWKKEHTEKMLQIFPCPSEGGK